MKKGLGNRSTTQPPINQWSYRLTNIGARYHLSKDVKNKWRERCGNTKTIWQKMAMGVDSRGLWEVFWKIWAI
jgi:hypothetical protein